MEKMSSPYRHRCQYPHLMGVGKKNLFPFAHYQIYGEVRGEVLKNLSFTGEDQEGERGFVDGCLELFEGKNKQQVDAVELREVESFLRTENHRSVFNDEDFLPSWFDIKGHFIKAFRVAESPLVCTCFRVSYKTIEDKLVAHPDLKDLVDKLKVSSGCGACLRMGKGKRFAYLEDIYNSVLAKIGQGYYTSEEYQSLNRMGFSSLGDGSKETSLQLFQYGPFSQLSLLRKVQLVTLVLDKKVRPFLQRDGGDVELLDIKDRDIFVSYQGSCGQCASATGGTLEFMTEILNKEFQGPHMNVIVEP